MTTANILKLATVFGAAGAAALTPAVMGSTIPTNYIGIAGVVVALVFGLLHYLEQKENGQTQQSLLQAIEQIVGDQIPAIIPAVAALMVKTTPPGVITGVPSPLAAPAAGQSITTMATTPAS